MKKVVVSDIDQKHLEIIRENVSAFLRNCAREYGGSGLLLDIAPQIHEGAIPYFTQATIHTLDINPEAKATYTADICQNNKALIPDNYFDWIVCTEVLEHTLNPFTAVSEMYRILKPGGFVFITAPFNFRILGPLPDCWRFTEHGLKTLLRNYKIVKMSEVSTEDRNLMPIHYTVVAQKPVKLNTLTTTVNKNKSTLKDLALFRGKPAFPEKLHVGRPNIGNRDRLLERFNDILDKKWLTNNGPYVQEFEKRIADMLEVKHCIAMCNGTIALEIAIRSLGLTGEVIVPSFTFVATAHALQWQEITPVFCDIDPHTHTIDPARIEKMITSRTTGIIGVHLWGRACNVEALTEISRKHDLKLLFDAAHAFGCSHNGRMIGGFGDAEVFSFHATKFLNTFEGGAIVTNNDELVDKIRLMKNFGFSGYDNVIYLGTNGKMNELSAAMGLTGLESLDKFIAINRHNYKQYDQELSDIPGIKLLPYKETEKCNYQYIVLEVDENVIHISRDQLLEILHAENIIARRYFYPGCHRMEPYHSHFQRAGLMLPETEKLSKCIMQLPTGTSVGCNEIKAICTILRLSVKKSKELKRKLQREHQINLNKKLNVMK